MDAVSKTTNRENLDWTQFRLSSKMDSSWNTAGTNQVMDLNDIQVQGNTIVGKGSYGANPDIQGEVTYSLVENTPLIKMEVKLTNTGDEAYQGYFEYLVDPDESKEDDTYVPGVGWTTSNASTVLTNHEWNENYIFEGTASAYTGYTAHAILWDEKDTTPTGLVNDSYIFGAWFDASLDSGESKTLTFYHLPHDPGGISAPYSEAAFWAKIVRGEASVEDFGVINGTVTDTHGQPVKNVDITCQYAVGDKQGQTAGTATTDENGNYSLRVEKDVYTLTATIPGYMQSSQSVDLNTQEDPRADMILGDMQGVRITQSTSMQSFGGIVECKPGDYTIENDMITMSIADDTHDGQLTHSSAGRILDIAFNGRQDAMDWVFTSWISDVKPHTENLEGGTLAGDSWMELDTRFDKMEVVSQSADKIVLKATGVYHHDLANNPEASEGVIEQIITMESGKPYAEIETTIRNTSGGDLNLYVGDIMDVDINSQKSYAPGIGDINAPYSNPIDEKASQPWLSQYSTAQQEIYSFLYEDDFDFNVFGNTNWLMGYAPVSLKDGESFTYNRQMIVLDTEGYSQAPEAMNAYYNAYVYGLDAGMEVYHVQGDKKMRLSQPQQMMASDRHVVDEAFAGDIIGVFDPGIFSIGDTVCTPGKKFAYEGIPTFAPEHFARVRLLDSMKRKQFVKGINQIAQEGAIQIFQEYKGGMEEIIVGVVGVLQFDVLKYRLENEYNVDIRLENLPYEHIRWIANKEEVDVDRIAGTSDMKKVMDLKGNPLLLFVNPWSVGMVEERNENLKLEEFSRN